jgi:hypothetical protein
MPALRNSPEDTVEPLTHCLKLHAVQTPCRAGANDGSRSVSPPPTRPARPQIPEAFLDEPVISAFFFGELAWGRGGRPASPLRRQPSTDASSIPVRKLSGDSEIFLSARVAKSICGPRHAGSPTPGTSHENWSNGLLRQPDRAPETAPTSAATADWAIHGAADGRTNDSPHRNEDSQQQRCPSRLLRISRNQLTRATDAAPALRNRLVARRRAAGDGRGNH